MIGKGVLLVPVGVSRQQARDRELHTSYPHRQPGKCPANNRDSSQSDCGCARAISLLASQSRRIRLVRALPLDWLDLFTGNRLITHGVHAYMETTRVSHTPTIVVGQLDSLGVQLGSIGGALVIGAFAEVYDLCSHFFGHFDFGILSGLSRVDNHG